MSQSGQALSFRSALSTLLIVVVALAGGAPPDAVADTVSAGVDYTVIPARLAGTSPNDLGTWTVDYERLAGGDAAVTDPINQILDDEAAGQVATYVASSSHNTAWTFHTQGRLLFRPVTISALFLGEYNAFELPNMPFQTVATRVFDARSGIQIVWENLFADKQAGLVRLSEQTKKILPTAYPAPLGGWAEYGPNMAPLERNFRAWVPTTAGIELHFPDRQFGRGLHVITVPWSAVIDLIAPNFVPITS